MWPRLRRQGLALETPEACPKIPRPFNFILSLPFHATYIARASSLLECTLERRWSVSMVPMIRGRK